MSPEDASPTHFRPATYAASDGERPAVITASGQVVTFAQLEERSSRLAQALFADGLRPGDHVAVLLPNDDRTHEVAFALQRSGLYYTMVNTHLAADEAAYIVDDCGAHTLITSETLAPLATELVTRTPAVERRLMIGATPAAARPAPCRTTSSSPAPRPSHWPTRSRAPPCSTRRAPPDTPRASAAR